MVYRTKSSTVNISWWAGSKDVWRRAMNLKNNITTVVTNAKNALNWVENREETEDIVNIASDFNVCMSIGKDFFP